MDSLTLADGVDQSLSTAGLQRFRGELYRCLGRRRDALFELVDALLAAEAMPSLPHLSLVPTHRRGWGSVYAALAAGEVDTERLAELLVTHRGGGALVFAVDASTWARCDAECSPGRGFYYSPTRHSAGQPIVAGWCYSWIAQLGFDRDSWTAPVDAHRVPAGEDIGRVTAAQVRALTGRLALGGAVPIFVFDAGYDPIALTVELADLPVAILARIRCDRVFYAAPAAVPGAAGAPAPARRSLSLCRPGQLAGSGADPGNGRRAVRPGAGGLLERAAPEAGRARPLDRLRHPADRDRHGDPVAVEHLPRP